MTIPEQHISADLHRRWWNDNASEYLREHGDFLGEQHFIWGPEGWTEQELQLLGPLDTTLRYLEVGAGAGQCSAWLAAQGCDVVASDISEEMLAAGSNLGDFARVRADARDLPFADASFDRVFTSYGVVPFIPKLDELFDEIFRVLAPGGRWVFSTSHPIRWAFLDDPSDRGLTVAKSYFDTTPYIETEGYRSGSRVEYAEFHRTTGEYIHELVAAGFVVRDLHELTWPERNNETWGGWSKLRGELIPGTLAIVADKP